MIIIIYNSNFKDKNNLIFLLSNLKYPPMKNTAVLSLFYKACNQMTLVKFHIN